jgi:hypothetical protein
MRSEVSWISLAPKFAGLDGFFRLVGNELVVDGGDIEFLTLTGAVSQGKSLAKRFIHELVLSQELMGAAKIGVSHGEI